MALDNLSKQGIYAFLSDEIKGEIKIDIKESVGSTNDEVKSLAIKGEQEGYLLISRSQTKGKGRLGRSFFSPDGTGVYMSLLLKPECMAEEATLITTAASVAVCRSLEKMGVNPQIKWVNDIFVDGKKVCGILTEAGFSGGVPYPDYVVLGVGINIYAPRSDFPEDLKSIAGAVFSEEKEDCCNTFIAEFINSFYGFYKEIPSRCHIAEYREKCFVLGKEVYVMSGDSKIPAKAIDIDENCNLIVEYPDGRREALGTGEISVRVQE